MFVGRTAAQVESLMGSQRAAEVEAAAWAAFLAEVEAARAAARPHKPGEAVWRAGPHGARLAAVEAFAVEDLRLASAERTLATQTLRGLGQPPSPPDAAELLQSVGWWPPHVQLGLVQAGVSEHFPPELEAAAAALLAAPPPDPDADRRRDFTHDHTVITVDDASTTEIDDGLSLERLPDGNLKVRRGADRVAGVRPCVPAKLQRRPASRLAAAAACPAASGVPTPSPGPCPVVPHRAGVGPHRRPLTLGGTRAGAGAGGAGARQVSVPAHRRGAHVPQVLG